MCFEDLDIANYNQAPMIEITYNWPDKDNKNEKLEVGRSFGHIAYRVKNIYQICEKLMKEGVPINRPPRDGYMAFVKSPDNISIELLQAGEPLEPQEPWKRCLILDNGSDYLFINNNLPSLF